jgi:hypothetical protein
MIMGLQLASPSINLWTPVFEQVDAVSGGRVALGLHSAAGLSWARDNEPLQAFSLTESSVRNLAHATSASFNS